MGNQAPNPSKRYETSLGGMFVPPNWLTPSKNKKHPYGYVGATQLVLLTCFILMWFFQGQATRIVAAQVWNFLNKLPVSGRENQMEQLKKVGRQWVHACSHFISKTPFLPADFKEQAGPTFSQSCAPPISGSFLLPQGSRYCNHSHRCHQVKMTCATRSLPQR